MTNTTKHPLQTLLEAECGDFELRSYRGRGMGEACLGAVSETDTDVEMMSKIVTVCLERSLTAADKRAIVKAMRDTRSDSMGKGTIVYWPDVPFAGAESDEE